MRAPSSRWCRRTRWRSRLRRAAGEIRRPSCGARWSNSGNLVSARFDQVEAKLYEIVGRLQLLTLCLIALFLGVFVWQISLARQIGALKAARRAATPASGRLG